MLEKICGNCGYRYMENEEYCPKCGQIVLDLNNSGSSYQAYSAPELEKPVSNMGCNYIGNIRAMDIPKDSKNKVVAGVLAILLGVWGVHKFYLGYTKTGIIMILITVVLCGLSFGILGAIPMIISLCEGIRYLTMSKEDFYIQYVENEKHWF